MTSPEQPPIFDTEAPSWTHDVEIGPGEFHNGSSTMRLKARLSTERYGRPPEVVPGLSWRGERTYVDATPYILTPGVAAAVGLTPHQDAAGVSGEVLAHPHLNPRHVEVGRAQAWAYPTDHTLVLLECYLATPRPRVAHPRDDITLTTLWRGFEAFLLAQFPQMHRVVTPAAEPGQDRVAWHGFLRSLGYEKLTHSAFVKKIEHPQGAV
jgi:hypothetical protein